MEFDNDCAMEFGRLRVQLRRKGVTIGAMDLLIAATALVHDLTLVTNNEQDFQPTPGLRVTGSRNDAVIASAHGRPFVISPWPPA
jgi:tRNA(fMet)-specific endonuclease VapC